MTKGQIITVILQEEKIKALTKRNAALESGYRSISKENERLRRENKKLKKRENELNYVNV